MSSFLASSSTPQDVLAVRPPIFCALLIELAKRGFHEAVKHLVEGITQDTQYNSKFCLALMKELWVGRVPEATPHLATLVRHAIKQAGPALKVGDLGPDFTPSHGLRNDLPVRIVLDPRQPSCGRCAGLPEH